LTPLGGRGNQLNTDAILIGNPESLSDRIFHFGLIHFRIALEDDEAAPTAEIWNDAPRVPWRIKGVAQMQRKL